MLNKITPASEFIRYTTPTHTLIVEGVSLLECDVYVTFRQNRVVETFSGDRLDITTETIIDEETEVETTNTIITVLMTQEESSKFTEDLLEAQVNYVSGDSRFATDIVWLECKRNLLKGVIADGDEQP